MIYINDYESPLGNILLAGDEQGLTGLWFTEGGRYIGLGLKKGASRREMDYFEQTKEWLDIYFSGRDPGFFLESIWWAPISAIVSERSCARFLMGRRLHTAGLPTNWQKSAGSKGCPHRPLAAQSVIIRSASSFRATG